MSYLIELLNRIQNLDDLIRWGGYGALSLIIFAETGLFFGFFLPGDSLLVTAGLFAARGVIDPLILFLICAACAIVGDATGFEIGRFSGKRLLKMDNRWINKKHLERTHAFYEKHGGKTIVIARFMPIVRTFAPLVAGIAGMSYLQFAAYNIAGGIAWVALMIGIGYGLGAFIPNIDKYIDVVILAVIFLSILPGIVEYARSGHWKRWFQK